MGAITVYISKSLLKFSAVETKHKTPTKSHLQPFTVVIHSVFYCLSAKKIWITRNIYADSESFQ